MDQNQDSITDDKILKQRLRILEKQTRKEYPRPPFALRFLRPGHRRTGVPYRRGDPQQEIEKERRRANRELKKEIRARRRDAAKFQTTSGRRKRLYRWIAGVGLGILVFWLILPPFVHPVYGPVTSGFFLRNRPENRLTLSLEIHEGVDFAVPLGTPVIVAKSGIVSQAGWSESFGNWAEVDHWLGFSTRYAHLDSLSVEPGNWVLKGISRIGRAGNTGRSTGNHLHFEVRWFDRPLPPGPFLFFSGLRRTLLGF